jgi:hypothetical protein
MSNDPTNLDFDRDAAWYRRFTSDAESNLRAFALRLQEAMPERVTIHETKSFFARAATTTGVSVDLDDHRYTLKIEAGRLQASIAMVVRGIVLNTKSLDPAEWFVKLAEETKKASEHAKRLSRSLSDFMAT